MTTDDSTGPGGYRSKLVSDSIDNIPLNPLSIDISIAGAALAAERRMQVGRQARDGIRRWRWPRSMAEAAADAGGAEPTAARPIACSSCTTPARRTAISDLKSSESMASP